MSKKEGIDTRFWDGVQQRRTAGGKGINLRGGDGEGAEICLSGKNWVRGCDRKEAHRGQISVEYKKFQKRRELKGDKRLQVHCFLSWRKVTEGEKK